MKPISQLTLKDVNRLRRTTQLGTNGQMISLTEQEVIETQKHLQTLYQGTVYLAFAERIAYKNKFTIKQCKSK